MSLVIFENDYVRTCIRIVEYLKFRSTRVCLSDPPGEPKDVEIAKYDKSSVTLKWKEPNDDGGNPILGLYCIVYFDITSFKVV